VLRPDEKRGRKMRWARKFFKGEVPARKITAWEERRAPEPQIRSAPGSVFRENAVWQGEAPAEPPLET